MIFLTTFKVVLHKNSYTESIFIDENYITNTLESFIAFQVLVHSRIRNNISSMYVGIVLSTTNL